MSIKTLALGRKKSCATLAPKYKRSHANGSFLEPFFYAGQKYIGEPRVLFIDIETSPIKAWVWPPLYETNVIKVIEGTKIICVSYKWNHEDEIRVISLPRYRGYKAGVVNDLLLCKALWKIISQADCIIAHNGDRFDIKKINGRFFLNGIQPTTPYITIDTLKVARKFLGLDSNKMGDICEALGIGRKLATRGRDTWLGCIAGDKKSWQEMEAYNKHDVDLLVEVHNRLLPWAMSKPNKRRAIESKI